MDKCRINIAIIEPSYIVYEGLSTLLLKADEHLFLYRIIDFNELDNFFQKGNLNVVIINPVTIQNKLNDFTKLKKHHQDISWLALVYSYFENDLLNKFDDTIGISDSAEYITQKVKKSMNHYTYAENHQEQLSEREIDVLILLVQGLTNKEIAEKLLISVHTVISHRKNIVEKTGIKSLPGLTIYAISKKILPFNTISF